MAFKPSMRRSSDDVDMDLDIRPVMNLMVVLIPLLIASAEWVKLGVIEINAPPSKNVGGGPGQNEEQEIKEKEMRLGLKIALTHDGITLATASAILSSDEAAEDTETGGPSVPKTDEGDYDFDKLREKLIEIKQALKGKGFKDENRAVITASRDIEYQTIITLMDNVQTYEDNNEILPLFPEVNFGQIIQ
jgi:biopolymer transport protein ExbD